MVTAEVVKILHLVDADDPVLAGEGLFERVEDGALLRKTRASDTVVGLAGREERVVVVI